ncbi:MAG: hypothetical protein J0I45_16185 [Bosea sp.]|nr:hypothetical protein [Bosea sp. (in: a-proteobacteria)]
MTGMVERVTAAIKDAVTRIDGDPVGVHLSYSIALDESNADETMAGIMSICEDAARAAIAAMREPTDAMRYAVWYDQYRFNGGSEEESALLAQKRVDDAQQRAQDISAHSALIDAALAEGEKE